MADTARGQEGRARDPGEVLSGHNSARKEAMAARLKAIKASMPLTEDEAVISSSVVMIKTLARQMKLAICALKGFESAEEVARLSGIAPVIERSGQSSWIRWRYFCPKFMRQSFHEYAGESVKHSFWARAYYKMQRGKGKSHQAAVRALAFKWIRIIYRCWQTRTPYNEVKYLENLRKKGSPLLSYAANNPQ